jgi:hypothetical protein
MTGTVGSQAQSDQTIRSSLPVLPMNVRFRFVPQYFVQLSHDDPTYSRIEALTTIPTGRCTHGNLLARRRFNDENIDWNFDAPDWVRARSIQTGASVLIGSVINRAKAVKVTVCDRSC